MIYRMFITLLFLLLSTFAIAKPIIENPKEYEDHFLSNLLIAAHKQLLEKVQYDSAYVVIPYPNGDVPQNKGVCTDVIIRAYRKCGVDFQRLIHEDMKAHFNEYPQLWNLTSPDPNIDHRRVPNLMVFFKRFGQVKPITKDPHDYRPGDIVTWNVGTWWRLRSNVPHIGIISDKISPSGYPLVIHNIGFGPKMEDILFSYPITGHFRYIPQKIFFLSDKYKN